MLRGKRLVYQFILVSGLASLQCFLLAKELQAITNHLDEFYVLLVSKKNGISLTYLQGQFSGALRILGRSEETTMSSSLSRLKVSGDFLVRT